MQTELGKLTSIHAEFTMFKGFFSANDIRYNYDLGGGAMMDMGAYPLSLARFLTGQNHVQMTVVTCDGYPGDVKRVDQRFLATLAFPDDVAASIRVDMAMANILGVIPRMPRIDVTIKGEKGEVFMQNYMTPTLWHYITVKTKDGKTRTEKAYKPLPGSTMKGEVWWTT